MGFCLYVVALALTMFGLFIWDGYLKSQMEKETEEEVYHIQHMLHYGFSLLCFISLLMLLLHDFGA